MNINELIGRLLLQNNCVVIPSFGGFVASVVSADINYEKGIITPPGKSLTFNKNLFNNDGLLVTALSEKEKTSYNDALGKVNTFVKNSKQKLNKGERLVFPSVGYLYLNNAGQIAFEQDRFFNLLLSSYGLGNVQFLPFKEEKQIKSINIKQENDRAINTPVTKEQSEEKEAKIVAIDTNKTKQRNYKKVVKYLAVAAAIPIVFYSFWIPMKTDILRSGVLLKQDFNPFKERVEEKYVKKDVNIAPLEIESTFTPLSAITKNLPTDVAVFSYKLTEDYYVPVRVKRTKEKSEKNAVNEKAMYPYHLIAGCFREKSNAEQLINQLKSHSLNAFILDVNKGLHRVSVFQSDSRREIKTKQNTISQLGVSSWVLKK